MGHLLQLCALVQELCTSSSHLWWQVQVRTNHTVHSISAIPWLKLIFHFKLHCYNMLGFEMQNSFSILFWRLQRWLQAWEKWSCFLSQKDYHTSFLVCQLLWLELYSANCPPICLQNQTWCFEVNWSEVWKRQGILQLRRLVSARDYTPTFVGGLMAEGFFVVLCRWLYHSVYLCLYQSIRVFCTSRSPFFVSLDSCIHGLVNLEEYVPVSMSWKSHIVRMMCWSGPF